MRKYIFIFHLKLLSPLMKSLGKYVCLFLLFSLVNYNQQEKSVNKEGTDMTF